MKTNKVRYRWRCRRIWEFLGRNSFARNAIANLCQSTFNPDLWKRIAYSNYSDSSKKITEITYEASIFRETGTTEFKPQCAKKDASIIALNTIVIQLNDTENRYVHENMSGTVSVMPRPHRAWNINQLKMPSTQWSYKKTNSDIIRLLSNVERRQSSQTNRQIQRRK